MYSKILNVIDTLLFESFNRNLNNNLELNFTTLKIVNIFCNKPTKTSRPNYNILQNMKIKKTPQVRVKLELT